MTDDFFLWAEALFIDDPDLRRYYFAGCLPANNKLDDLLSCYRGLFDLQREAGLLGGAQIDCED